MRVIKNNTYGFDVLHEHYRPNRGMLNQRPASAVDVLMFSVAAAQFVNELLRFSYFHPINSFDYNRFRPFWVCVFDSSFADIFFFFFE